MGKLTRDDRFQMLIPDSAIEGMIELKEVHGVNAPVRQIFTDEQRKEASQLASAIGVDVTRIVWVDLL